MRQLRHLEFPANPSTIGYLLMLLYYLTLALILPTYYMIHNVVNIYLSTFFIQYFVTSPVSVSMNHLRTSDLNAQ